METTKRTRLLISLRKFHVTQLENADVIAAQKIGFVIRKLDRRIKRRKRNKVEFVQSTIDFNQRVPNEKRIAKRKKRKKKIKKLLRKKQR